MAGISQLSVQAIKGKFEQMQDVSFGNGSSPSKSPACRRRRGPFSPIDPSPHKDSPPLSTEEVIDETYRERVNTPSDKDSRPRSHSVGNSAPSVHRRNGNEESPFRKMNCIQNFTQTRRNGRKNFNDDSTSQFPNNHFSSFSEKQRLVESIVMNIKNSSVSAKKKEEEQRNKDFKAKEILNITSKFEKDLKNVLERGVRRKWNDKTMREEKHFKETFLENRQKINTTDREQILNNQVGSNRKKSLSKINAILGVDLYPMRSSVSVEIYSKDSHESKVSKCPVYKSESSPVMFNKLNNRTKMNDEKETQQQQQQHANNSFKENLQISHSEKRDDSSLSHSPMEGSFDMTKLDHDLTTNPSEISNKTNPVRPPRRRVKKNKAPLPPSPHREVNKDSNQENKDDPEQQTSSASKKELNRNFQDESQKACDDSSFYALSCESTRRSSSEPSKESVYEDRCEKNLRRLFFCDKENNKNIFDDSVAISYNKENDEQLSQSRRMSQSESSLDVSTIPLPAGAPPKKPPRTFAYDVYRSLKVDQNEAPLSASTPKLTSHEVEPIYTKPLKRLKDKPLPSSFSSSPKRNPDICANKPAIAPKPVDIINKAKQRLSVSEPLPSAAESREFSDCRPSMKRNSSFRFSFRKHKKSSESPPRGESQVGRRLRMVAKNWHPKKNETEKKVRFHPRCNSETIYNDVGGPIYAIPSTNETQPGEKPKELHYMCSPLFQEGAPSNAKGQSFLEDDSKENFPPNPNHPFRERLGLMDGLKEELRQSCRLVQKRLKPTANKETR